MDFNDKLQSGAYKTKFPYPGKPKRPAILDKAAGALTKEELDSIPQVKERYQFECDTLESTRRAYREDERRLEMEFWKDMCEDYGVPQDHPFIVQLRTIAWDKGHSSGYSDVHGQFVDLLPLWEEAKKMVPKK